MRLAGPDDGEVVILLHGFPQTSYEWRHQLRALGAAGFRAVAPDQRGYSPGARPPDVADYALPLLVRDVLGLADAIGARRFHIGGHDWGAAVAWAVAVAAPERVITANPVSAPHPDAFGRVLSDPMSCQVTASSYFDLFVQPHSEDAFLANDHALLRAVFAELEAGAADEYVRVLGSQAALGAALNLVSREHPQPQHRAAGHRPRRGAHDVHVERRRVAVGNRVAPVPPLRSVRAR